MMALNHQDVPVTNAAHRYRVIRFLLASLVFAGCAASGGLRPPTATAPPVGSGPIAAAAPPIQTVQRGLGMTSCKPFRGIEMKAAPVSDVAVIRVLFATGSHSLTPAAERVLEPLGEALRSDELRPYCFRIEGHTDEVGSDESNRQLSERRAQSVARFLTERFAIPTENLTAVGFGETEPMATNATPDGRTKNRRVQITNLGTRVRRSQGPPPVTHEAKADGSSPAELKKWLVPK